MIARSWLSCSHSLPLLARYWPSATAGAPQTSKAFVSLQMEHEGTVTSGYFLKYQVRFCYCCLSMPFIVKLPVCAWPCAAASRSYISRTDMSVPWANRCARSRACSCRQPTARASTKIDGRIARNGANLTHASSPPVLAWSCSPLRQQPSVCFRRFRSIRSLPNMVASRRKRASSAPHRTDTTAAALVLPTT